MGAFLEILRDAVRSMLCVGHLPYGWFQMFRTSWMDYCLCDAYNYAVTQEVTKWIPPIVFPNGQGPQICQFQLWIWSLRVLLLFIFSVFTSSPTCVYLGWMVWSLGRLFQAVPPPLWPSSAPSVISQASKVRHLSRTFSRDIKICLGFLGLRQGHSSSPRNCYNSVFGFFPMSIPHWKNEFIPLLFTGCISQLVLLLFFENGFRYTDFLNNSASHLEKLWMTNYLCHHYYTFLGRKNFKDINCDFLRRNQTQITTFPCRKISKTSIKSARVY